MNRDVLIINIVLNSHSSHNKNIPHPETLAAQLKLFLGHQKHQLNDVHQLYIIEYHRLPADGHGKHRSLSKQLQSLTFQANPNQPSKASHRTTPFPSHQSPASHHPSIFLSSTQLCFESPEHRLPSFPEHSKANHASIPSTASSRSVRPLNIINRAGNISLRIIKAQILSMDNINI